jgi:RND family efflux transporter MFP subunit
MHWRWLAWGVAGLAAAGAGLAWWLGPTPVQTVLPVRATAVEAIYASGSVEPSVMLPIAPRVAGTLAELTVDEGSTVRKGQLLARLDDTDLKSTVEEQSARTQYARENFERNQDLVRRGFVSPGELDRTRSDLDAADAALRRAHTLRNFAALTAPADGVIIRRDGEIGQYFPAGQALFTMSCCAPLRVAVEVDEEDILKVHVGQKAVLRTDALPASTLDGVVSQVTPKGDPVARSYRVRIRLADPQALKVGMTVDANLIVAERPDALLVPSAAVQSGSVWVVRDGRLSRQAVKTGVIGAERTEILEGLTPSAHVVLAPGDKLAQDHRVYETLQDAAVAPGGAAPVAGAAPAAGTAASRAAGTPAAQVH